MADLDTTLAPGFIRLRYTGVTRPHTAILPIKPASPMVAGVEPTLETSGGGEVPFGDGIAAFVTAYNESFAVGTKFGFAEVYAVDPDTGIRTFIFAKFLDGTGNSDDPQVPLVEGVWSFKCTSGKPLKIYAMEGTYNADVRTVGVLPADGRKVLADYIVSVDNVVYGRSNAWPLAFLSFVSKENDVLRRNSLVTS